ncbi:M48 family metalloprotease [Streptosporangium sp. NPDC002524]|uniref:M48 family metalloprotease n=1 Tax=Streptosporangium sp. NPDC002524 TaxID=3154537 RepID=UPI003330B6B0
MSTLPSTLDESVHQVIPPGVAQLASALVRAAHAPAVLVTIDPTMEDGGLSHGVHCDSVPRVILGAELLDDEMRLYGVLVHEVAHHALRHGQGAIRQWEAASQAAAGLAGAAIIVGLPVWVTAAAAVAAIAARLASARVQRREEYEADRYSVRLLDAVGMDGHAIVTATLAALSQESRFYRLAGWIVGSHPTPDARRHAIRQAAQPEAITAGEPR